MRPLSICVKLNVQYTFNVTNISTLWSNHLKGNGFSSFHNYIRYDKKENTHFWILRHLVLMITWRNLKFSTVKVFWNYSHAHYCSSYKAHHQKDNLFKFTGYCIAVNSYIYTIVMNKIVVLGVKSHLFSNNVPNNLGSYLRSRTFKWFRTLYL